MTAALPYRPAVELSPFPPGEALPDDHIHAIEEADRRHLWKPFTQMAGYVAGRPLVIRDARANWLRDVQGRAYLDGVSSLWVNLHGHNHPTIVSALKEQLDPAGQSASAPTRHFRRIARKVIQEQSELNSASLVPPTALLPRRAKTQAA